jgi:hypothetical protein
VRRAVAPLAALVALSRVAGGVPPRTIAWQEAADHVGQIVAVEGDVAAVRMAGDTCVLEFKGGDPRAFRAVLLLPLLSSAPRDPERLYAGKHVRVSGRVERFQGRAEMVLRSPGQIEVMEPASATSTPAVPPVPPAPAGPPEERPDRPDARTLTEAAPCERARARWRDAAAVAGERAALLGRCLEAMGYRCRSESAALDPALSALERAEQQVEDACR